MKIERHDYSRAPWRLVTSEGRYVSYRRPFEHPSLGWTVVDDVIAGETKAECTQKALDLLESLLSARTG